MTPEGENTDAFVKRPIVAGLEETSGKLIEARKIISLPHMRLALKQLPYARTLFEHYAEYGTVEDLLWKYNVPPNRYDPTLPGEYLFDKANESSLARMATLAQRFTLGNWINPEQEQQDGLILRAAVFVLERNYRGIAEPFKSRLSLMKLALTVWMSEEFKLPQTDSASKTELFPPNYDGELSSVVEAYRMHAETNTCPQTIKDYAELAVMGMKREDRIKKMPMGQFYRDSTRKILDWHLLAFLEKTLANLNSDSQDRFDNIYGETTIDILRKAKTKAIKIPKKVHPLKLSSPVTPSIRLDPDRANVALVAAKALILKRISEFEKRDKKLKINPTEKALPNILLPASAQKLLDSPSLGVPVGKWGDFIPKAVVEKIIISRYGNRKHPAGFSAFMGTQVKEVKRIWGKESFTTPGQRIQYWPRKFVKALFTHMVLQRVSKRHEVNRMTYTFVEDFDLKGLEKILYLTNLKAAKSYLNYNEGHRSRKSEVKPSDTSGESGIRGVVQARRRGRR